MHGVYYTAIKVAQKEVEEMKTLVEIGGEMTPMRAKKDERPATQIAGRGWKEIPMTYNGNPTTGLIAGSGHWLYFTTNDMDPVEEQQWYKLDATYLDLAQVVKIESAPETARKTPEEQKEARKARREARKERRQEAKQDRAEHASDSDAFAEMEEKEKKAMKRKAAKAVAVEEEEE